MSDRPFFSVIIPSHNGEKTIKKAIRSVREQTFVDYELIVVCDACTDRTEEIAKKSMAIVVQSDHHREGLARNAGLYAANGHWILFLDDDDWFLHEYCFQMIHDAVSQTDCNVLNYGYIWKGKGYQGPRNHRYCMAWARAWKSDLICRFRFDDSSFGTDKNFYQKTVLDNSDAKVGYLDTPIVYYNYFREGSMTQKLKKHKQLTIIVTHYNEPWEVGKKLFDMLENQVMVDMESFSVVIVQDGAEGNLPWDHLLSGYSYETLALVFGNGERLGTAQSRNIGLKYTDADWVMFCDFDDMFTDITSLHMIMSQFRKDVDMLCGKVMEERRTRGSDIWLAVVDGNRHYNTHCKAYRQSAIKGIIFHRHLHYQAQFNDDVMNAIGGGRIGYIQTDFPLYCKKLRDNSYYNQPGILKDMIASAWIPEEKNDLIEKLKNNFLMDYAVEE